MNSLRYIVFIFVLFLSSEAFADNLDVYLERCADKRSEMEQIFIEEGVSKTYFALCLAESGCKDHAESNQSAKGICQLMPATARTYGLTVNKTVDERLDWRKNTRASAKYLKHLESTVGKRGVYKGYLLGGHNYLSLERKYRSGKVLTDKEKSQLKSARDYDAKVRAYIKRIYK